jgi:hypothetical protein
MCMLLSCRQNSGQNHEINSKQIVWKCVTVQIFGNDSKQLKGD